jgi:transposase-like protein
MAGKQRRNPGPAFHARVALAAIKSDKTLSELAEPFEVHAGQITAWKRQLHENASVAFGQTPVKEKGPDIRKMQARIGQPTLENDFPEHAHIKAGRLSAKMRRMAIDVLYRKSGTNRRQPGNAIYPCLLRNVPAVRPIKR